MSAEGLAERIAAAVCLCGRCEPGGEVRVCVAGLVRERVMQVLSQGGRPGGGVGGDWTTAALEACSAHGGVGCRMPGCREERRARVLDAKIAMEGGVAVPEAPPSQLPPALRVAAQRWGTYVAQLEDGMVLVFGAAYPPQGVPMSVTLRGVTLKPVGGRAARVAQFEVYVRHIAWCENAAAIVAEEGRDAA